MSRLTGFLVGGAILVGATGLAVFMVSQRPEPERVPPPSQVPFAITAPAQAGEGAIPVFGAGTVRPRAEVDIAAEVSGKVVWVDPAFQSGGRVREGQVLFRIDDVDYRRYVEKARANVALQRVEVLKVKEEAQVARKQYEQFKERQAESGAASEASPLALWQPQLEAAEAALAREHATLAETALNLARTAVKAPFSGVVRSESVDVGQFVAAGRGVARLYASDAVEVVVPLSDREAALVPGLWDLRAGDGNRDLAVQVVADYGGRRYDWDGYVDRIEGALDEQTRTLDVIVRVPEPYGSGAAPDAGEPPLLVGKFVDVELEGIAPDAWFRIRRPALRPGNEVWVVRDDRVTILPVTVLQRADDEVYVTGALQPGDAAIVGGIQVGTDGMEVRTASAQPE
ncbi:MAG: efflux RND transporter periplasmic adaptor subunit [Holophagales bacterium]|nr:efflux RND transporter periplasmic adaptor subunit [Holophagales bacterium]MYD22713.1 efflux RND transporter periplasmic adaptor subunit [Holophagales bacterium]MYI31565.1 efflux RND transporter periplasmic adaptor subunit [Holophagales bacterium]